MHKSIEETLNGLLEAEADELCMARRYERNAERASTRAGHYERGFHIAAGPVRLKLPKLRHVPFETVIIERYWRREVSEGARTEALAYMAASWGIKRMEKDREGKPVFVLADGQKIHDKGNREFERPKPRPQREKGMGFER